MRLIALCLLAAVVLCSGQGCPSISSIPATSSPIAEGAYSGDVTYSGTAAVSGSAPIPFDPYTSSYTCEFGSNGLPLVDSNTSVYVGADVVTTLQTNNDTNMTVTAVRAVTRGVAVDYDVVMKYQDQGHTLNGTGTATDTFKLSASGRVDYTFDLSLDFTLDGAPVHMVVSGKGPLSKQ